MESHCEFTARGVAPQTRLTRKRDGFLPRAAVHMESHCEFTARGVAVHARVTRNVTDFRLDARSWAVYRGLTPRMSHQATNGIRLALIHELVREGQMA